MFYEEREFDGCWQYRTIPNGEWRDGRLEAQMTPPRPAELPELLPCPFCGGKAEIEPAGRLTGKQYISCFGDDCPAHPTVARNSLPAAITAWNTRALAPKAGAVAWDVAVARRERDEAIEERDYAQLELAYLANEMVYDGNSIGWIASKAKRYAADLGKAWSAVCSVGGTCDGKTHIADAIRQQLRTPPTQPEVRALVAVAKVVSVDEYGPCLEWSKPWTDCVGKALFIKDAE